MSDFWSGCGCALVILALCFGIGGCCYLVKKKKRGGEKSMKHRKHHNNSGRRQIQRGNTSKDVARIAKKLKIKYQPT